MFLASATVPIEEFAFTTGSPASYESVPGNLRLFCGICGSSVGFRVAENPKLMDFNLGSLDNPELIKPDRHLFTSSQVTWCKIDDDLPRYPEGSPETGKLWIEDGLKRPG